jgi:hypothetical protein
MNEFTKYLYTMLIYGMSNDEEYKESLVPLIWHFESGSGGMERYSEAMIFMGNYGNKKDLRWLGV